MFACNLYKAQPKIICICIFSQQSNVTDIAGRQEVSFKVVETLTGPTSRQPAPCNLPLWGQLFNNVFVCVWTYLCSHLNVEHLHENCPHTCESFGSKWVGEPVYTEFLGMDWSSSSHSYFDKCLGFFLVFATTSCIHNWQSLCLFNWGRQMGEAARNL